MGYDVDLAEIMNQLISFLPVYNKISSCSVKDNWGFIARAVWVKKKKIEMPDIVCT